MPKRPLDSEEVAALVQRAQAGETAAFDALLRQFQDVTVAYAHSILHDRAAAEDAAQDAFIDAFRHLVSLREPAAFPGWLRQIVWKHCDRQMRRSRLNTVEWESAAEIPAAQRGLEDVVEESESQAHLLALVTKLPPPQREAVVLFYFGANSQREIAAFLGVPTSTVVKRLQAARTKLKSWMRTPMDEFTKPLHQAAPSLDACFVNRVMTYFEDPRGTPDLLDPTVINRLLEHIRADDYPAVKAEILTDNGWGDPLCYWLLKRDLPAVERFIETQGEHFDIFMACFFGLTEQVRDQINRAPELVEATNSNGWTPLDVAAHEGHYDVAEALLEQGAQAGNLRPIIWAAQNGFADIVKLLIDHGCPSDQCHDALGRATYRNRFAAVDVLLGHGLSASGLLGMAAYGSRTKNKTLILQKMLENGADVNERDEDGFTPLFSQIGFYGEGPNQEITSFLIEHGAKVDIFSASGLGLMDYLQRFLDDDPSLVHARGCKGETALHFAAEGNQMQAAQLLVARGADIHALDSTPSRRRPVDCVRETDGIYVTCDTAPLREFLTPR